MTFHVLLSLMAFLALASGKAQRRPDNWITQPTRPDLRFSDYEETDSEDLQLNRQRCKCYPEPRSQSWMLGQSEKELPEVNEGRNYKFSTFYPGARQIAPDQAKNPLEGSASKDSTQGTT